MLLRKCNDLEILLVTKRLRKLQMLRYYRKCKLFIIGEIFNESDEFSFMMTCQMPARNVLTLKRQSIFLSGIWMQSAMNRGEYIKKTAVYIRGKIKSTSKTTVPAIFLSECLSQYPISRSFFCIFGTKLYSTNKNFWYRIPHVIFQSNFWF